MQCKWCIKTILSSPTGWFVGWVWESWSFQFSFLLSKNATSSKDSQLIRHVFQ